MDIGEFIETRKADAQKRREVALEVYRTALLTPGKLSPDQAEEFDAAMRELKRTPGDLQSDRALFTELAAIQPAAMQDIDEALAALSRAKRASAEAAVECERVVREARERCAEVDRQLSAARSVLQGIALARQQQGTLIGRIENLFGLPLPDLRPPVSARPEEPASSPAPEKIGRPGYCPTCDYPNTPEPPKGGCLNCGRGTAAGDAIAATVGAPTVTMEPKAARRRK